MKPGLPLICPLFTATMKQLGQLVVDNLAAFLAGNPCCPGSED